MLSLDDTADLHTEFCITLLLNILVSTINNNGHPAIAKPLSGTYPTQPSDDADDVDDADLSPVLNAVATILVRKLENIATIACKPLPPANSVLSSGPNPYQIYALENIEPMTCLGSEASLNDADCTTSHDEGKKPSNDNDDDVQQPDGSEALPAGCMIVGVAAILEESGAQDGQSLEQENKLIMEESDINLQVQDRNSDACDSDSELDLEDHEFERWSDAESEHNEDDNLTWA
ncbi:hypothetical protein PILCRDRAFT_2101 [Piloderma croceum F 1598]|uniref:Uncharacterized protein n=1 Tax=Piloderma croceum (strain F 1598) TaxID=765440 RepID=A0A0C3GDN6_PILCF|nr:hypothetical protein PILCRDRAFT_2101 [Piloderma croceum F 1598]